jgi:hypothetical protein
LARASTCSSLSFVLSGRCRNRSRCLPGGTRTPKPVWACSRELPKPLCTPCHACACDGCCLGRRPRRQSDRARLARRDHKARTRCGSAQTVRHPVRGPASAWRLEALRPWRMTRLPGMNQRRLSACASLEQGVMGLRMARLCTDGSAAQAEAHCMVSEKTAALAEATMTLARGGSAQKVIRRDRTHGGLSVFRSHPSITQIGFVIGTMR